MSMGSETLLRPACELSYVVARDGVERSPAVDPPPPMRSFLYVSHLPGRAMDVARDVIDGDATFRRRVAERATEDEIGRAGFLWLHRPNGWAAEFEEIVNKNGVTDSGTGRGGGKDVVPAVSGLAKDGTRSDPPSAGASLGSYDGLANGGPPIGLTLGSGATGRSEANAIEDELSSLRGLVERLSNERKAVSSSARRVEQEIESARQQPSKFDTDLYSLQSDLDSIRSELDQARQERDTAVRQQSEALTRQLELEKELARSRDLRAEIEQEHAVTDGRLVEVQESLARAEAALVALDEKRMELESQLTVAKIDHDELKTQMNRAGEEQTARYHALETSHHALQAEADQLKAGKDELGSKLADATSDLEAVRAELAQVQNQAAETQSLVDALTEEKIDLASRLADTEAMLETMRSQINAIKADAQAVSADLANVRAHRDGLSAQVDELHGSLTEALNDMATVRSKSDDDRAALKEVRAERDQLRVRVTSLEQTEAALDAKVRTLTKERDESSARAEKARRELGEREKTATELGTERDRLAEELTASRNALQGLTSERDALDSTAAEFRSSITELETERDGLRQQVEQLTEENSGIQAQLVESDRLRVETGESQGHALSELAHRLSMVENERNHFERELRAAEDRLIEAMAAFDAANEAAAKEVRSQVGDVASHAAGPAPRIDDDDGDGETVSLTIDDSDSDSDLDIDATGKVQVVGSFAAPPDTDRAAGLKGLADITATFPIATSTANGKADPTPARAVPPSVLGDQSDAGDLGESSSAKRWNFGPLARSERAVQPDGVADGPDDVSLEDPITAPPIRRGRTVGGPTAEAADYDIDGISTELAQAVGGPAEGSGEVDLDAISDLISQTVTDFDPNAVPGHGVESEGFGDEPLVDSGPSTDSFEVTGKRAAGGAPPSVFGDGDPTRTITLSGTAARDLPIDGGDGKQGRRQIDIPVDLLDDEVEMARHVVSSPDVVLLVDGDSVAKMGWPSLPVAQQRDALVSYLADLSTSTGAAPDVVFDGRIGEEDALPSSRSVRIRLSTPPTPPTAALDELVDAYPEQWPIAIVTDDDDLTKSAMERGATVLNNGQLLDLFISQ